jgi:hypothetical protein
MGDNLEPFLHEIDLLIKWVPQKTAAWIATWEGWKIFLFHIYEEKKEVNAIYFASDGKNLLIDSNWSGIKKKISDTKPIR